MKKKIRIFIGIILVLGSPLILAGTIIGLISSFHNFKIIVSDYTPETLNIIGYFSRGNDSADLNQFTGKIDGEEKSLTVSDSIFLARPKFVYVFSCEGQKKLIYRKKEEILLNKAPYERKTFSRFVGSIIISLFWWFSTKCILKQFKSKK